MRRKGQNIMKTIATHQFVDMDAITSAWLASHLIDGQSEVKFFPANTKAEDVDADIIVDFGKKFDGVKFFDHHQTTDASLSATKLVFDALVAKEPFWAFLSPLVDQITDGDWLRGEPTDLHYLLSNMKGTKKTDQECYAVISDCLRAIAYYVIDEQSLDLEQSIAYVMKSYANEIAAAKQFRQQAADELESKISYRTAERGVSACIVENSTRSTSAAAYEAGYDVVAYVAEPVERNGANLYPRGIVRRDEVADKIHLGNAVEAAIAHASNNGWNDVLAELESWFCHPASFMVGLSEKADSPQLSQFDRDVFVAAVNLVYCMAGIKFL